MFFRENLERIMADANLLDGERNLLVDTLVPYVLSYSALSGLEDDRIKEILVKLDKAGQLEELTELLEEKAEHFTPTDNIGDGSISMIH